MGLLAIILTGADNKSDHLLCTYLKQKLWQTEDLTNIEKKAGMFGNGSEKKKDKGAG